MVSQPSPLSFVCAVVLALLLSPFAHAQVLIKEVISREASIHVGGVQTPEIKEVVSREASLFIENGLADKEVISREVSFVVPAPGAPPAVTGILVTPSPTGDSVFLDWTSYNPLAVRDVDHFDIYISDTPFFDVTGLTPVKTVGGETVTATVDGLTAFRDHFIAIVAVDVLGNRLVTVVNSAAYIISPQVISREVSFFVGGEPASPYQQIISREVSFAVATPEAPPPVTDILVTSSPTGDAVSLDWTSYNPWAVRDVDHFDIYISDAPFTDVTGMTPVKTVGGETVTTTVSGLTPFRDHFIAIVAVDLLGNRNVTVTYSAAYIISPQVISREVSMFVGGESLPPYREAVSREVSMLVPSAAVPAPVTGLGSGFTVATSATAFGAVDLDWTSYNEAAQLDVVRYRIYVGNGFFETVTGLTPFATVPAGNQRFTLAGLTGNGIFHFAVVAEDVLGGFDPAVRSFSAQASISSVGEARNLSVVSGATSLDFTWAPPPDAGAFLQGFRIYFGGAATPVQLPATATSFSATGLSAATGYPFRITTLDPFGGESGGVSLLAATILPNPQNLALGFAQSQQVVLSWDAVQPASLVRYYAVYRSATPFSSVVGKAPFTTVNVNSVVLGSLASVTDEYFAVVAVNISDGSSPNVTTVRATKLGQTIAFQTIAPGPLTIPLVATASSGLPVRFAASPQNVAAVSGANLIVQQGGAVNVTAVQDGNDAFWPASSVQSLRLPPVITSVTANGVEVTNGMVLTRETTVAVQARDADGILRVEFFGRAAGGGPWLPLFTDSTPVDGFSAVLPVGTLPDGAYEFRVVATTPTNFSAAREHAVTLALQPVLTLTFTGDALMEGASLTGQVTLQRARPTDLAVTVSSARPTQLDVGPPVTIPAGQTSAAIQISGIQDEIIEPVEEVAVRVNAPGAIGAEKIVNLLDDDWPALTLTVDRNAVSESAGPSAIRARVVRDLVTSQPLTVSLTNSAPTAVAVPAQVVIPAGQAGQDFFIGAVDDALVDGAQTAAVRAEVRLGGLGAIVQSNVVSLEVGDDEGPTLELVFDAGFLREGRTAPLLVRRGGGPVTAALTVQLAASLATELQVPASLTIPAGASEASATIAALNDGTPDGGKSVVVTATAAGHSPGQVSLVVTDETLPDLVATALSAPTRLPTESDFQIAYRIENRGDAAAVPAFTQRVFLSRDLVPGNDILLRQYEFPGNLAAGVSFGRQETVRAPREAGTYYLLVVTDIANVVPEVLETNNATFFAQPIVVEAAYSATVSTDVNVVPANTPIPLTGTATKSDSSPAAFSLVNIHIRTGQTERVISALTNSAGAFTTSWLPLPGEGGEYEIGASHPGVSAAPTQDTFAILTAVPAFPTGTIGLDEGSVATFTGTITNPTLRGLTGLTLQAIDAPPGLSFVVTLPGTVLAPGQVLNVGVQVAATNGFSGDRTVTLRLTTDQGVTLDVPIRVSVRPLVPRLVVSPDALRCSVVRGTRKTANFTIRNDGGLATGPLNVLLPNLPWLSLASPSPLPSIAPGETAAVSVNLEPGPTEALTQHTGTFVLAPANGLAVNLPFAFRIVSDLRGDLAVDVVDEYFYFTEAAPKLAGATVIVRDAISAEEIVRLTTGANGVASFPNLLEGWYAVEVTAPQHTKWKGNYYVNAGEVNRRQVFISREMVTYTWTVEPIEIEDRYRITVETTFETNVPVPVVTVSPATLDVGDLVTLGASKVVNMTLENHGFIDANHGEFDFGTHPFYEIVPLIQNVGTIPAKSSLVVPVTLRRIGEFAEDGTIRTLGAAPAPPLGAKARAVANTAFPPPPERPPVPCGVAMKFKWDFICGIIPVLKITDIAVSGVQGNCPGGPFNPQGQPGGPGGSFTPGPGSTSVSYSEPPNCLQICLAKAVLDCVIGYTPFGCPWSAVNCAVYQDAWTCGTAPTCAFGPVVNTIVCIANFIKCYADNPGGGGPAFAPPPPPAEPEAPGTPWLTIYDGSLRSYAPDLTQAIRRVETALDYQAAVLGNRQRVLDLRLQPVADWHAAFGAATTDASEQGPAVSPAESAQLATRATELGLVFANLQPMIARWNRSYDYFQRGIRSVAQVPAGESTDFLPDDLRRTLASAVIDAAHASEAAGATDPFAGLTDQFFRTKAQLEANRGGVCSRVKIRLDQEAVLTRSAFRATLELQNNLPNTALTGIRVDLEIRDALGQLAGDVFNVRVTDQSGFGALDGTGALAALATGSAQWTLIPRDTAAPLQDTAYTVGGTISYLQAGVRFTIPVQAIPITVKPDAALYLKYFHQRDVFSDDPHTDPTEPAIPFALAVLVENRGAGAANHLRITSAQPQIVDNEKGLFIDFKVIASEVAGLNLSPSLTADFGDIAPGGRKVATWLMTSTLQGLFTDYKATFEHLDGLGDPRISLIKEVEIHEMIHLVEALGARADGKPDFLVNDVADINDYPDTIHLSDGTTEPVTVFETATFGGVLSAGNLTVTLNANLGFGWAYLRVPDPGNGRYRLASVRRSDGLAIPLDRDVWVTDRTFIGLGRRPIYENILHLLDYASTGQYTLTYLPVAADDTTPPESRVAALAPQSGVQIPLEWSGTDNRGVAFFDIYAAVDGGAPVLWKERTTLPGGIYTGAAGRTYAFYSIATDLAGNREAAPATPDATTTVSLFNEPPIFAAIPNQTVAEGATWTYQTFAADNDSPLTYQLGPGAPAGMTIDALGTMRWVTGENNGGQSYVVSVQVTDNGFPAASTTRSFGIQVVEVNSAPSLVPPGAQTVAAGSPLLLNLSATDRDIPAQSLTFSLTGAAPAGLSLNPATGVLTWTPTTAQIGSYTITAQVTDSGTNPTALSAAATFTISVAPASGQTNLAPRVLGFDQIFVPVDAQPATLDLGAGFTDLEDGATGLTYAINGNSNTTLFNSVTLNPATRQLVLNFKPNTAGTASLTLRATDSGQLAATSALQVRVTDDPYEVWLFKYFPTRELIDASKQQTRWGLDADPDLDGVRNRFEWALLRNPAVADRAALGISLDAAGHPRLAFERNALALNRVVFGLAVSSDLAVWQSLDVPLSAGVPGPLAGDGTQRQSVTAIDPGLVLGSREAMVLAQEKRVVDDGAAANDQLGRAVAIDGATVAFGVPNADGNGAVMIAARAAGASAWSFVKQVAANDGLPGDRFGNAVSLAGDALAVGAFNGRAGTVASGAVYLFQRNAGGADQWGQIAKIVPPDAEAGDSFGFAVALSGDTLVVGAFNDGDQGPGAGSAYVFARNQGGANQWGFVKKLRASDAARGDTFGYAVAVDGGTIVVGSRWDDDAGSSSGSAYVFARDLGGANQWGQVQKLTAADGSAQDQFGHAVAISGSTILIGAPFRDEAEIDSGAAYVFTLSGTIWSQSAKLPAVSAGEGARFGHSVALRGLVAVVGARFEATPAGMVGTASLFRAATGASGWVLDFKVSATDGGVADEFGASVALSAEDFAVGAPMHSPPAGAGAGYLYPLTPKVEGGRYYRLELQAQ